MSVTLTDPSLVEECQQFLKNYYKEDIIGLFDRNEDHLYISYSDLFAFSPAIADDYLEAPELINAYLRRAIKDVDLPVDLDLDDVRIRVTDEEGMIERTPVAGLRAKDLGNFVAVEGQLSKVTGLSYRFETAVFECKKCTVENPVDQPRTGLQEPTECDGCERQGPFEVNISKSDLVDQRKLKLESPPEDRLQGSGESITAYADRDLCHVGGANGLADRAGERVVVLGKLEGETQNITPNSRPETDGFLLAEAVVFTENKLDDITVEETREQFEAFAAGEHGDPVDLLKESIAPRIERTDQIDMAIEAGVAWLFNSFRIERPEGDQIRGDLHMGLIGDPSTAKSTIMAALAKVAPKSVFRSGGSISKVGLTAAAQQEEFAGTTEWTLEPGVLPRANGGHCLIDEVDEVLDERSKAIHDALEGEQMVKVDKAGISADLPTRTALCVSGNPKDGRFDPYSDIADQLDMDPALISRMDVLLPVTDDLDPEIDERIADTIVRSYHELAQAEIADRLGEEPPEQEEVSRPVPVDVFRDWVHYARENCFPLLTPEAMNLLKETYLEIRNINGGYEGQDDTPIPATSRVLEAGIRLSTAFARVELSEKVTAKHTERAKRILKASIGLNFDSETGQFDAGTTDKTVPQSQKERIKALRAIIKDLGEKFVSGSGDGVPIASIVDEATNQGLDEDKVKSTIEDMKTRDGSLVEPKNGEVRTV